MPVCAVHHCSSRSGRRKLENLKLFNFPKDTEVRKQWLAACQHQDGEIKLSAAAICEIHFTPDCFEDRMTQHRTASGEPRMMRRLKIGSVPTLHLGVYKKKGKPSDLSPASTSVGRNKLSSTKTCFTGIPTYAELLTSAREKKACEEEESLLKGGSNQQGPASSYHENDVEKQDFDTSPAESCAIYNPQ